MRSQEHDTSSTRTDLPHRDPLCTRLTKEETEGVIGALAILLVFGIVAWHVFKALT